MRGALIYGLAAALCALPLAGLAADAGYRAPRNAFGQPDLSGNWSNATLTPQVRPTLFGTRGALSHEEVKAWEGAIAAKDAAGTAGPAATGAASDNVGAYDRAWIDTGVSVMRVGGEPRTSLITTRDGQPPPPRGAGPRTLPAGAGSPAAGLEAIRQAAAFDQFEAQGNVAIGRAGSFDNPEGRALGERCLISFGRNGGPPMFPNGWYNNNYIFAQGPTEVAIVIEMVHDVRHIRLNSKHRTDQVRPWFGDSIGWWEGETLVVETDHIPKAQAYFGAWEKLRVTERFTRVAPDRIRYRFTADDPTVWDRPWGGEYEFHPLKGQVLEYACHEGNYALPGILAGAREEEKRAAAAGGGAGPGGSR